MRTHFQRLSMAALVLLAGTSVHAASSGIIGVAALGPNDSIDWGQFAVNNTGTPAYWTSSQGHTGHVATTDGNLNIGQQGTTVFADFTPGDQLLVQQNFSTSSSNPYQWGSELVIVTFDTPVKGFGANFQSLVAGNFYISITPAFASNANPATYTFAGSNTGGGSPGAAPFFGVLSTGYDITGFLVRGVNFTGASTNLSSLPFAMNQVQVLAQAVPEPATSALFVLGAAALAGLARRRVHRTVKAAEGGHAASRPEPV